MPLAAYDLAMLAQSDSGAAALGIVIALALIGLQIYLIYAIIATRQDVRVIRGLLGGGREQSWQGEQWGPATETLQHVGTPRPPIPTQVAPPPTPMYRVILRASGTRPDAVAQVLMDQAGYARSGARGARPGQQVLATKDLTRAQGFEAAIHEAGGRAEIQATGAADPSVTAPTEALAMPPRDEFKTCPDCAEEVRAVARKCRFCGHTFDEPAAPLSS
jgi:hypothetical protein